MNGTPTIILASLSDDKLKESINSLVKHVNEKMEEMVESTNSAVKRMEDKLKSLGSLKIDSGGTNDGGAGRRTQQHEKLTKAVNDASEAVSKETQKLQDLQQSLSGVSDREQNFVSQKERAANTISKENELLQRQETELAQLKTQQQQLADAEKNGAQSAQQQESSINRLKNKLSDLKVETRSAKAALDLLKNSRAEQLSPIAYTKNKAYDELAVANKLWDIMKRLKMDMNNGSLMTGNATEPIQKLAEYFKISREEAEKMIRALRESSVVMGKYRMSFDTRFGLYDLSMEKRSMLDKNSPFYSAKSDWEIRQESASKSYELALRREEKAEQDLALATNQSTQASQQKAQIDTQVAAKEKEIADTKVRIATATKEQSEADKNASQAAKEKANIQSQVANQEKQVAEAKKQLTTATQQQTEVEKQSVQNVAQQTAARDKQIKKNQEVATSFDQMANAQQKAVSGGRMGIMETYNMQIELFKNRLREVRQDIDIFNAAIGSGKKTQIEWGQQGLKQANAEAEKLMRIITTLENQRGNLANVLAPQGHTIQNYVNSLQKANPELAQLNDLFKRGKSLMQNGITTTQQLANAQGELNTKTNQQKQTLDEMNAHIRQNIQREQERRDAIRQTGLAAQDAFAKIRQNTQIQFAENTDKPIKGIKELADAIANMRRLYFDMSTAERESPLGLALKRDIENAQKLKIAIDAYNRTLTGMSVLSTKNNANSSLGAYTELTNILKTLSDEYKRLGKEERNAAKGNDLADKIQRISRATQKIQQQMNRPISLAAAMKGDEKTLDDIAYKMQRLRAYRQGIDLTKPNAANEIKQVDEALAKLQKEADKWMNKSQEMIKNNTALGRSWNYMKNRLAFYFTVGASTQFVKNLIEVRSQYEMNERALGILINSAERGTQIFNELSQMALVSPYTLIELSSAAKQLTAYDIAAKDVVNTTRRLADMAAAVGIPIERLTYALGQVKAYGYLNARDARMFANAGIPLVKNLSEYYTELEGRLVSTADIYDRIKKKQIGYEEVMSTISKMTDEGGKFFDFQAKMAETLKVQLANLTLAWNNMLNDMGEESQGVLVGGIGALKQMFLHWKDIEHILTEVVVALGAYKAYQLVTTRLMGATSASLDAQILAMKRNNAAMLEKQALTRKLTVDELRQVAAQNQVTAADYRNALSGKNLTKQKALLLVALNKNNVQLKAAIVNMGLLTAQEAANVTTGRALSIVFKSIGISIRNAAMAMKAFMVSNWWMLALGGIYELYHAWDSYNEHVEEVNRSAAEHAKEAFENIKTYLEGDVINTLRETLRQGGKVSSDAEGQKAWDEMREKIELSSSASNVFIARLMQIDDINARLSAGFGYLEDIQRVAGVMQTLEEDAIEVSSTSLGGLFGEGLKDDLQDYIKSIDVLLAKYGDIGKAREDLLKQAKDSGYIGIANTLFDLASFILEVRKTTNSLYDAASKEGLNANQQREFFEREISEIAQAEQMGAKETRIFRMQAEKEYYAYARAQLVSQLEYQQGAQKAATERRIKDLDDEFGTNKAMQENFFTWLTEKQDHAVKNMLRGKTQEEIKQGDWLKDANGKWVEEMARKFSKEYGVSFDDLHRLVMNANTWSINIPVFFQTIGQPLTDVQRDYEARTGKKFSSNPLIKDAKTQVEILDILKKKQKEVAAEKATAEKAGGKYWEENKQRYEEENNALIADIHAYNALTDAEEKANKKSGKGGSKKDPLLDALKQEISLVEKLQSDYDKLSKSGASQADALDTIRGAYGKTIRLLNAQLGKYGLPKIDISQLITGKDPHKALEYFKQTLDTLVSKGLLTLELSKEIEAVIDKFTLSAKTYDLDMITKGLNNELGKLKDEYELAVELDANPELGGMFTQLLGIDTSTMSHSIDEYMDTVRMAVDKARMGLGYGIGIDIFGASEVEWQRWAEWVGISNEKMQEFRAMFEPARSVVKKWATDTVNNTKKLEYELAELNDKIAIKEKEQAQLHERIEKEKNEATKHYLELTYQSNEKAIDELRAQALSLMPEYARVFNSIAEYSAGVSRRLQRDLMKVFDEAKYDSANKKWTLTGSDGKQTILNDTQYRKEREKLTKEMRKSQAPFKKIKEAFKPSDKNGVVDYAKGIELLGGEIGKVGGIVSSIGDFAEKMGFSRETVEIINDVATSLNGVSTMAQGIGQIASGDYIGGAASVLSGLTTAVSTWFDNADNKITDQIKDSELAVKRLELTYIDLEHAINNAYGMATIGANQAAIANKELQLVELKRQLVLEQSRDSKHKDEDRIIELRKQIKELEYDIKDATDAIVNDLLGISSVGDALENLMGNIIESFRSGSYKLKDIMKDWNQSINDMIANMVKKMYTSKILEPWFEEQWQKIQEDINKRASAVKVSDVFDISKNQAAFEEYDVKSLIAHYQEALENAKSGDYTRFGDLYKNMQGEWVEITREEWIRQMEEIIKELQSKFDEANTPTAEDIKKYAELLKSGSPIVEENLKGIEDFLRELGLLNDKKTTTLSALQQGISQISESTAGALEAYMNGVSQQVYYHSSLLEQIRDSVVGLDLDVSLGVQSQMLLQLQNSYQTQQAIQQILEGVLNPSGRAFSVELLS